VAGLIREKRILSAHDISEGGLFISLLESAMAGSTGFSAHRPVDGTRPDAFWFGESQGRVVVSVASEAVAAFEARLQGGGLPYLSIGEVTEDAILLDGADWGHVHDWKKRYDEAIGSRMAGSQPE
jgi:phosphoribosylformylglycinamidine synthase